MEPIVVPNQAEYNQAEDIYLDLLKGNIFDIDKDKGLNALDVIKRILDNYLYNNTSKDDTEEKLTLLHFTRRQAKEITDYFKMCQPKGLLNIEQGLNFLGLHNAEYVNWYAPLIRIKNSAEIINVLNPVEVFGKSHVAAFYYAQVAAHDRSSITAYDKAIVYALDNSSVIAYDNSLIITKHLSLIASFNSTDIEMQDQAVVIAKNMSRVTARQDALVFLQNYAVCKSYDNAKVITDRLNKPENLNTNVRYILDHPFVKGKPERAINLLIASSNPSDKINLYKKIKELGAIYPKAVKNILQSQAQTTNANKHKTRDVDNLWER